MRIVNKGFSRSRLLKAAALALVILSASAGVAPAQISGGLVRIGVITDKSGPYADGSGAGSVAAAKLAIEDFGGSILGTPIDLISADHQNKPDIGAAITNRWLDLDGVDAIADVPTSSVMLALQEIVRTKGGILLVSGGAASSFTGAACSPYGFHWSYDTYALARSTGASLTSEGEKSWFLVQVDYAFGTAMANDLEAAVRSKGGRVIGSMKFPLNAPDFSSQIVAAQGSGADVVAIISAGADTSNFIKQAHEFALTRDGKQIAVMALFLTDIHGVGLETMQGILSTEAFYWDLNARTRAWSDRFQARHGGRPTSIHIGVYSAVLHYLKAVQAAGTDDRDKVAEKMRALPVDDAFVTNGTVRADGRMVHDMLLAQVKTPAQSTGPWDYQTILRTIPGEQAFRPASAGGCPLAK